MTPPEPLSGVQAKGQGMTMVRTMGLAMAGAAAGVGAAAAAMLSISTTAFAQSPAAPMAKEAHAQPNCPADAEPIPPALAGWTGRAGMVAGTDADHLDAAQLALGKGVELALRPTPEVRYALRPENPGGSVSHGGMVALTIASAGAYRVAISSAAWLDVVRDGASLTSVGHGRGPACSGIRKMVDFALQPGRYVVQIAGNGQPAIGLLVTRLP